MRCEWEAGIGEGGFVVNVGSGAWRNRKGKQEGVGFILFVQASTLCLETVRFIITNKAWRPGQYALSSCI